MFRIDLIDKGKNTVKIIPETIDQFCRLCLKQNGSINIFVKQYTKKGGTFVELISLLSLAEVQKDDGLPTKICNACATKLNDFFKFKQQIETSQVLLYIAMGKVIIQPGTQSNNQNIAAFQKKDLTLNKNQVDEIIATDVKEETTKNQSNKVDRQTNTVLTFSKDITGGSVLYNMLSNKEGVPSNNEIEVDEDTYNLEPIDTTDINSIMECWKSYHICIACNSNPNSHPECNFYSFPIDQERCEDWIKIMKLDKLNHSTAEQCHKRYYLCNKHFKSIMFYGKDKNKLRKTALPTDFEAEKIKEEEKNKKTDVAAQTETEYVEVEESNNNDDDDDDNDNNEEQYLLCDETLEPSDTEKIPIEIADHSYTKKKKIETKKEKKKKEHPTKFQCVSINADGNKVYTCCFCLEAFEDRREYFKHKFKEYKRRKPKPKVKITCTVCGKLVMKDRMKDHMNIHTGAKPYVCETCGKCYRSGPNLTDHKQIHLDSKNQICELCGKAFNRSSQLLDHLQTHNTEPNFICDICGYPCWSRQSFKQHERRHRMGKENFRHSQRVEGRQCQRKNYCLQGKSKKECKICFKKFESNAHLVVHMRSHTGERPYKCLDCGKDFMYLGGFNSHKLLHTGVKPHACEFCGKRFLLNGNLQQHIRTHTGDKPYKCELCEKRFYTNSALRKHLKIHEKI